MYVGPTCRFNRQIQFWPNNKITVFQRLVFADEYLITSSGGSPSPHRSWSQKEENPPYSDIWAEMCFRKHHFKQ